MALRPLSWLSCVVCVFLLPGLLRAQQPTGAITGVITDPSGAIVPGVSITIVHKPTQSTTRATTSSAGLYELRVEAKGFKRHVIELTVEVGRVVTADVLLQVGAVTETVTVEANGV